MTESKPRNPLLNETIVFRPLGYGEEELLRYAGGQWLPDDGTPDLAFITIHSATAYGISLPSYTNILWAWRDLPLEQELVGKELAKYAHGWHYYTINNEDYKNCRLDSDSRHSHPNEIAYRDAMDKCCSIFGIASGRSLYLTDKDKMMPYISTHQIWTQQTMQPLLKPNSPICFLCLNGGLGHKIEAFNRRFRTQMEDKMELEARIDKLELDLYYARDELKHIVERLGGWKADPLYREEVKF